MEIRLATLSDMDALGFLLTEFFDYNANLQPMYCRANNENGKYPESVIKSSNADFLVAIESDVALGFIHIIQQKTPSFDSVVPHDYAEIMAFMVTAASRGQGIGARLIDAAKRWSKARSLDYIELISLDNAEANAFYDHKNFITVSHIRRYAL